MSIGLGGVPPDEQLLTLARADRAGWGVLVVSGAVDIATERRLLAAAREPLDAGRPLVVDLGGVDFLSSSGAAQLVALAAEGRSRHTALRIVTGGNPRVSQLFVTLGLDRTLDVYPSLDQALSP